ncbi:GAF domain-containing protein [Echinicola soli]|uniref:GAF domain-containing protein n=1 Tax=Echinicola soli TaxID=2591634 RepID=A0A514CJS8_9BACT|nr:LuxR C-terminal-related transcriptional regulator [Echinicola soli]QDH79904.1 GAF domain-containing protein [Echinicola soli]
MDDKEYFSHLYEIAKLLNKEFSLHAVLTQSLKKTIELLHLDTGWIWLVQAGTQNVYLAASYNLPPALAQHPERLSGQCFCIQRYLADELSTAQNISEITCSRLKNIASGTRELKFHATIPIMIEKQKVGLINLVSRTSQRLNDKQLYILNTISELISTAILRTWEQGSSPSSKPSGASFKEILQRILLPQLSSLEVSLHNNHNPIDQLRALQEQFQMILADLPNDPQEANAPSEFHYPTSPLTDRELEILSLVKSGLTNKRIAEQLFISERTVKFHLTSVFSKLFAKTRTEAVQTAIKRGFLLD